MKAAVLGTQYNTSQDAHTVLHAAGINVLQRMAGFVPARMPDVPVTFAPVESPFVDCAGRLIVQLCEEPVRECNPRVPYLFLAWLLVGSDNDYRATQYVHDHHIVRSVAAMLISIACGEAPSLQKLETIRRAASTIASSATWKAAGLAVNAAQGKRVEADRVVSAIAWTASNRIYHSRRPIPKYPQTIVQRLQERACEWRAISDEAILEILYRLVWDIYHGTNDTTFG